MNRYALPAGYCEAAWRKATPTRSPRRPAGWYARRDGVETPAPPGSSGARWLEDEPEWLRWTLGEGELEFDLYVAVSGDEDRAHALARALVRDLERLDACARSFPDPVDHEEALAYVTALGGRVELHYFATTVASEWAAVFAYSGEGTFRCLSIGLRDC